ncbi:hypothetical protein [Legionella sp.]|uniref:hypothetical protein n=1 Tax=Legionella sp. TaxID=459 RepID=UPI00325BFF35
MPYRLSTPVSTVRDYYYSNETMMTNEMIAYEQAVKYDGDDLAQLIHDLNHFHSHFPEKTSRKQ